MGYPFHLHRSQHRRFSVRWTVWLAAALLGATLLASQPVGAAFPEPPYLGPPDGFTGIATEHFQFVIEQHAPMDAEAFVLAYGNLAEHAYDELVALLGAAPEGRIMVEVFAETTGFQAFAAKLDHPELLPREAIGDPVSHQIAVDQPRLLAGSPLEAENALRHAVARVMVGVASNNRLPRGFAEGIAQYVERPVTARQARIAALLQNANQQGKLLSWSDLNRPQPPRADPDLVAAHTYAVVAFLVDRHGLRQFRDFVRALPHEPDWRSAMRTVYKRSPTELEQQWRENLPRWSASGWRDNLFAAFDLQPARDLLRTAHYEAANAQLERSLRLYTELGDPARQAEVEKLLHQGETGIQAEALMAQVQEALERHTYDRAKTLLGQARNQYNQLGEAERPTETIAAYDELAASGLRATTTLEDARRLSRRWVDYPRARSAAVDAGRTFARLGDEEQRQRTLALLNDLDVRQRRLVLMLGALAALTLAWLVLWLWARGPAELDWG